MSSASIMGPVFAMILLTMAVWFYMYARRIPFIQESNLSADEMTPLEFARASPPHVANPSDNLKNLFEIPVLFYVVCLYLYLSQSADVTYVVAGWLFFVFRALHSAVHCTVNIILLRFWLYCIATLIFWFMALRAVYEYLVA